MKRRLDRPTAYRFRHTFQNQFAYDYTALDSDSNLFCQSQQK